MGELTIYLPDRLNTSKLTPPLIILKRGWKSHFTKKPWAGVGPDYVLLVDFRPCLFGRLQLMLTGPLKQVGSKTLNLLGGD